MLLEPVGQKTVTNSFTSVITTIQVALIYNIDRIGLKYLTAKESNACSCVMGKVTVYITRVATVREKVLENEKCSRSGKSQGISFSVREI